MAEKLSTERLGRYNPDKPMENRITDLGPRHYWEFFPPIIKKNYGKWKYHEIVEPGILVHVSETGDKGIYSKDGGLQIHDS